MTTETLRAGATAASAAHHGIRVLAILSALMGFASISTDFYLPAMPTMAAALHTDAGTIGLTISGYLVGFSAGQLLWGPVSDRYGRRAPIWVGLLLFVIGSVGCALSGSAWTMIWWRVVQAGGASAGVVLSRAMVRDLYVGNSAAKMLSTLITVMAIAPLLGPILGAHIMALGGLAGNLLDPSRRRPADARLFGLPPRDIACGATQHGAADGCVGPLRKPSTKSVAARLCRSQRIVLRGDVCLCRGKHRSLTSPSITSRPNSTVCFSGPGSWASWPPTRSMAASSCGSAATG